MAESNQMPHRVNRACRLVSTKNDTATGSIKMIDVDHWGAAHQGLELQGIEH